MTKTRPDAASGTSTGATPDAAGRRASLAALTDKGWAKVTASAPEHVNEVRRLIFDPLSKAQQRQLAQIAERILKAIDPSRG